jgi:hypothetical protein
MLGGVALRTRLGDEVLFVAGQPAEPVQHRQFLRGGLRRQVDGDVHVAAQHLRSVAVHVLPTAARGAVFDAFHGDSP